MKILNFVLTIVLVLACIGIIEAHSSDKDWSTGYEFTHTIGLGGMYSSKGYWSIPLHVWLTNWGVHGEIFWGEVGDAGEYRERNSSNYGRTKISDDDQSEAGGSFGISRKVAKHLWLGGEMSVLSTTVYDKYRDQRFTEGHYKVKESDKWKVGYGAIATIPTVNHLDLVVGYNTIKGVSAGILLTF